VKNLSRMCELPGIRPRSFVALRVTFSRSIQSEGGNDGWRANASGFETFSATVWASQVVGVLSP